MYVCVCVCARARIYIYTNILLITLNVALPTGRDLNISQKPCIGSITQKLKLLVARNIFYVYLQEECLRNTCTSLE